jgi:hypothetical protein
MTTMTTERTRVHEPLNKQDLTIKVRIESPCIKDFTILSKYLTELKETCRIEWTIGPGAYESIWDLLKLSLRDSRLPFDTSLDEEKKEMLFIVPGEYEDVDSLSV